ncbi:MAG: hypothetical protein GXP31_08040 [Kiritimatiellaeota bacterium]|nr:hypothetical protein [Kiritimatiellota bacterium]
MAKHVDSRPEKLGWVAVVIGAAVFVLSLLLIRAAHSWALVPAAISSAVMMLTALVAVGRVRLARRQYEEELDVAEYRASHAGGELFEESDEALQVAARANRAYITYFVPVFTVLLGMGILVAAIFGWRALSKAGPPGKAYLALRYAALAIGLFLACVISGSYYVGASRERHCRWLRPCGAWLFLTGAFFLLGAAVLIGRYWEIQIEHLDIRVARLGFGVLMLLGGESVIGFIVEFYRPRSLHEELRPLYESRFLALFTEPGGIARNVAASLDYQFGFQVSEAWFFQFLERAVIPLTILMVVFLWLLSCLVVVEPDEQGIRERLGRVVSAQPLGPGLYAKLPWPFARIFKFPVERVQQIPIGYTPGRKGDKTQEEESPEAEELRGDMTGRVIVWSKTHNKKENLFIVAAKPEEGEDRQLEGAIKGRGALPVAVYFMSASIPLYFRVNDLYAYAYRHKDPKKTLEEIATREVVRYLANVDFFEILTQGRAAGGVELKKRIQTAADKFGLGIEVDFVGLQGLHPPVRVGKAFDEVVAAMETKHETVLKVERYQISSVRGAESLALALVSAAKSYKEDRVRVPQAEAARFIDQLHAYRVAPRVFVLRTFLDMLENEGRHTRKYVTVTGKGHEVLTIDLKEKLRPDLLDLNLQEKSE